jgi:hypothetical protein
MSSADSVTLNQMPDKIGGTHVFINTPDGVFQSGIPDGIGNNNIHILHTQQNITGRSEKGVVVALQTDEACLSVYFNGFKSFGIIFQYRNMDGIVIQFGDL